MSLQPAFVYERNLENYFDAKFSEFDKEEIIRDLLAVSASVHCQAMAARAGRLIYRLTNVHSVQFDSYGIPKVWPVVHVTSIALAQLTPPVDFSDFVDLIRKGFPNKAPDLERRRAAIVALAFGHLGLCKALLDNEEVPVSQRATRLFQLSSQMCSFHCSLYDPMGFYPFVTLKRDRYGPVMEAVVRGKSDAVCLILQQNSSQLAIGRQSSESLCRSRHGSFAYNHPGFCLTHLPGCFDFILKSPIDAAIVRGEHAVLKELLLSLPGRWWNNSLYQKAFFTSLQYTVMLDNLAIFDLLLNAEGPIQLFLRKMALPAIGAHGNSAFLTKFFMMTKGSDFVELILCQFETCVKVAIDYKNEEFIQDLFMEVEKCGVDLGLIPVTCLHHVLAKRSHDLLRSYLLASEKSFSGIPRTVIKKVYQRQFMMDWPKGVAYLFSAGFLGEEPLSLTKMCLSTIRRSLLHPVTASVQQLPLPKVQKKLLLFQYF